MTRTSRRRWPWIVAATLLAGTILAAVLIPQLVDPERHRGRLEAILTQATGWEASLGRLDLSVFQGLALTVDPLGLSSPSGESRVEAEQVSIHAELLPLIRGELRVRRVVVRRPVVTLVRVDEQQGWIVPLPGGRSAEDATAATSSSPIAVRIDGIELRDGSLHLEDRVADPVRSLRVGDLDLEVLPEGFLLDGSGVLADDGGRLEWTGSIADGMRIRLEGVRTEALAAWIGQGVLRPGGRFAGDLSLQVPHKLAGRLIGEELALAGGVSPLARTEIAFALGSVDATWRLEQLELRTGDALVTGGGSLSPLALDLQLQPASLETALGLARALFPLDLDLRPPGSVALTARLFAAEGGQLSYDARGTVSAASYAPGGMLPATNDLRTAFHVTPETGLELEIQEGTMAGGPLRGDLRIDRLDPPGSLVFDGTLVGAAFGELLAGFVDRAPERLAGPAEINGRITVDLGRETIDAQSIRGKVRVGANKLRISDWGLEQSLRQSLREKMGALAEIAARVDPSAKKALAEEGAADTPQHRLLDRVAAELSFDAAPWDMQTVELTSGGVTARGGGRFDPSSGALDLRLVALLDRGLTERYLAQYPRIRPLVNPQGQLSLPFLLRGPATGPKVEVKLDQLLAGSLGEQPKEAAKGLLEGWLDKKLSGKK